AIGLTVAAQSKAAAEQIPTFQYDPSWPKPLPNNWMLGNVGAMAIDAQDNIWIAQRPATLDNLGENYAALDPPIAECCRPAPPIIEFDQSGKILRAWGAIHDKNLKLVGPQVWGPFPNIDWPQQEHGILVDHKNTIWVVSNHAPSHIQRFTPDGKF